jgi:hypothetical protein
MTSLTQIILIVFNRRQNLAKAVFKGSDMQANDVLDTDECISAAQNLL